MSYKKNVQVEVLPVVNLCQKSVKWLFFCGRCNTGEWDAKPYYFVYLYVHTIWWSYTSWLSWMKSVIARGHQRGDKKASRWQKTNQYVHRAAVTVRKRTVLTSCGIYIISYQQQQLVVRKRTVQTSCGIPSRIYCDQRIPGTQPMVHTMRAPEKVDQKRGKTGKQQKGQKKKKKKIKKNEANINMRWGRRPSPEGTRLLLAGTISPMTCPGDGPTEAQHDKTRRTLVIATYRVVQPVDTY